MTGKKYEGAFFGCLLFLCRVRCKLLLMMLLLSSDIDSGGAADPSSGQVIQGFVQSVVQGLKEGKNVN